MDAVVVAWVEFASIVAVAVIEEVVAVVEARAAENSTDWNLDSPQRKLGAMVRRLRVLPRREKSSFPPNSFCSNPLVVVPRGPPVSIRD